MAMAGKTKITCRVVKPSQALCWTFVMSLKTRVFIRLQSKMKKDWEERPSQSSLHA